MNGFNFKVFLVLCCIVTACNPGKKQEATSAHKKKSKDKISLSFAFIGCNRIAYDDRANSNTSKANVPALKRIFNELSSMEKQPDLLFFLGDLVLGEKDSTALTDQLAAWVNQYKDTSFSPISTTGIELIPVTGNHEMLFYDEKTGGEYPLKGATEVWLEHMMAFMPRDRNKIMDKPFVNGATFSFVRDSVAFVVMNTDTYNDPEPGEQFGKEGQVPAIWINNEISEYAKSDAIKHVFTVGHRPYYVDGKYDTLHGGFPDGPKVWPTMVKNKVVAMLTAHQHQYQRWQPEGTGTYEIIAGQGGTYSGEEMPQFYGYSIINIYESNRIELVTKGWDLPNPTWGTAADNPSTVRDTTTLTWGKNANPYSN